MSISDKPPLAFGGADLVWLYSPHETEPAGTADDLENRPTMFWRDTGIRDRGGRYDWSPATGP